MAAKGQLRRDLAGILGGIRKALPEACDRAAGLIAAEVRRNSPVLSGRTKASVAIVPGPEDPRGASSSVEVSGGHPRAFIGSVEFGHLGTDPNPFIRRSFDRAEDRAAAAIVSPIEGEING